MRTTYLFSGVNEGYSGTPAITDPNEALNKAANELKSLASNIVYQLFPGKIVYKEAWGCPKSGETIVAITSTDNPKQVIEWGKIVKNKLKQTTLTTATYESEESCGELSRGFQTTINSMEMDKLCLTWQEIAEKLYEPINEIFVAAAFYQVGDKIHIQGEVRPNFKPFDTKEGRQLWEEKALEVAAEVNQQLKINIQLNFHDVYINFLEKNLQSQKVLSKDSFFPEQTLKLNDNTENYLEPTNT